MKSHNPLGLTTKRRGAIGECIFEMDALKKNLEVYAPLCDDMGIDYLIRHKDKYYTIQVKYHRSQKTQTAVCIKIKPCPADIIAVPFSHGGMYQCFYVWNRNKKRCWNMNISVIRPLNNQKKNIHFSKDYLRFPPIKKGEQHEK